MAALRFWPTTAGMEERFYMQGGLAAEAYLRLFRRGFWDFEFFRRGHDALKLTTEPVPSLYEWEMFSWNDVATRYGLPASQWMYYAWERLKDETDSQILWRWLYYRTVIAVETQQVNARWYRARGAWLAADRGAWVVRQRVEEAYDRMEEAVAARRPGDGEDPLKHPADPPVGLVREFFAAVASAVRYFNVEATYNQNFAANYLRLEDGPEKLSIFERYAEKMRTRIEVIYIDCVQEISNIMGYFNFAFLQNPTILRWVTRDERVTDLMVNVKDNLTARLNVTLTFFEVVRDLFSDEPQRRQVSVQQLAALPSGGTRTLAQRIERMAKFQYSSLNPNDPQKQVAEDWMQILQNGDTLRNPPKGSDGANINAQLQARTAFIDQQIISQEKALQNQIPDPKGGKAIADSGLQTQQPAEGKSECLEGDGDLIYLPSLIFTECPSLAFNPISSRLVLIHISS